MSGHTTNSRRVNCDSDRRVNKQPDICSLDDCATNLFIPCMYPHVRTNIYINIQNKKKETSVHLKEMKPTQTQQASVMDGAKEVRTICNV